VSVRVPSGPAGVCAAFAAARRGASVILVEQANCLGGIATSGLHGHICLYSSWGNGEERVVGGIPHEIAERVVREGFGAYDGAQLDFEVEGMKLVLEKMAAESGEVKLLYYTQFSDVVVEEGRITNVIVQSKSGRQAIRVDAVIDCTGDGDVAARAGVPFEIGRAQDGLCQPMTLMFQIGGVDFERVNRFRQEEYPEKYPGESAWQLTKVWEEAQQNGDMEPFQDNVMGWWHTPTRPDQLGINFTHITGRSTVEVEDLTYATIEGRCISCTHVALGSLRVMPQCMLEGEAVGVAAEMSLSEDTAPGNIDVAKLQENLRGQGAIVSAEDIVQRRR
jgi:hypothetical protein